MARLPKITRNALPLRASARKATLAGPAAARYGRWAWLGGVSGALSALVWFAPAAWLAAGVAHASAGQVQIADARGSVWQGSGQLLLTGGVSSNDVAVLPDRLQWQLWPTLTGLKGTVLSQCCSPAPMQLQIKPQWGGGQLDIRELKINLPAEILAGLGTPWNTLSPQGKLALRADTLAVQWIEGRALFNGNATLDMTDISSRLSTLRPLGDYRLSMMGGEAPSLQLQTLQGALQLTGSGQWVGSRMRFTGEASASPEREAALANLLNIIGRRQGNKSLISLG